MRSTAGIRRWRAVHTWSSLACTVLLLAACLTGLPLIFADEIEAWQAGAAAPQARAANEPLPDIDALVAAARLRYPREAIRFVFIDDEEAAVKVVMAPADRPDRSKDHRVVFDARTGAVRDDQPPPGPTAGVMAAVERLHTNLFLDGAGDWLLAATGLLFLLATISGAALYGPYMKTLAFGTVRRAAGRKRWLDLHNLAGAGALAWMLAVAATGAMNALTGELSARWRGTDMSALLAPWRGLPPPAAPAPADGAYRTVRRALPGMNVTSIIFPSQAFSNPHHYLIWANGNTALTRRLFTASLVDAATGELTAVAPMPFYLRALQVSRPLHFGDFGGLPMKLLWALLDLATIFVLASGLYLWLRRLARG